MPSVADLKGAVVSSLEIFTLLNLYYILANLMFFPKEEKKGYRIKIDTIICSHIKIAHSPIGELSVPALGTVTQFKLIEMCLGTDVCRLIIYEVLSDRNIVFQVR